jgi:hypothetical protein
MSGKDAPAAPRLSTCVVDEALRAGKELWLIRVPEEVR